MGTITSLARRKKSREADRTRVLEAAEKLFRKHGFDDIGMRDIAEAAATNPVQLYRLGLSKAEILGELIVKLNERQIREMKKLDIGQLGITTSERVLGYLLALYRMDIRDKELRKLGAAYGWLWPKEREAQVLEQIIELVTPVANELQREGLDDVEDRCRAIWSLYYGGFRAAVIHNASAEQCLEEISGALNLIFSHPPRPA
jgi:AcrR family transcriptional regulator